MIVRNARPAISIPELLQLYRGRFPFRLARDTSRRPHPDHLSPGVFGELAKVTSADGDEWFFESEEARNLFLERYGGTPLPSLVGVDRSRPGKVSPGLSGASTLAGLRSKHLSLPQVDLSGLDRVRTLLDQRLEARGRELKGS